MTKTYVGSGIGIEVVAISCTIPYADTPSQVPIHNRKSGDVDYVALPKLI